jgi:hypothetical protein
MLASDQQFLELQIESPELHLLWHKPELSDEERVRLSYFLISHHRMRENNWFQHQNGILDDATWRSYRGSIPAILSTPRTRVWWHHFGVERLFNLNLSTFVSDSGLSSDITSTSAMSEVYRDEMSCMPRSVRA